MAVGQLDGRESVALGPTRRRASGGGERGHREGETEAPDTLVVAFDHHIETSRGRAAGPGDPADPRLLGHGALEVDDGALD